MSTNELGYFYRFNPSQVDADSPLSADVVRFGLVGNSNYLHDMAGQVRVAWMASTTGDRLAQTFTAADQWEHVRSFGPFPLTMQSSGAAFYTLLAAAGSVSTSTGVIRLSLNRWDAPLSSVGSLGYIEFDLASATDDWISVADHALEPSVSGIGGAIEGVLTDLASGGPPVLSQWPLVRLDVYAQAADDSATVYVSGVYLREYIGDDVVTLGDSFESAPYTMLHAFTAIGGIYNDATLGGSPERFQTLTDTVGGVVASGTGPTGGSDPFTATWGAASGGVEYVQATGVAAIAQPYSVVAAFTRQTGQTGSMVVCDSRSGATGTVLRWDSGGNFEVQTAGALQISASLTHDFGVQHHVLVTFNGASSELYIDDFATPVATGTLNSTSFTPIRIGTNNANGSQWRGTIDGVYVISGALDADQRAALAADLGV